MCEPKLKIAEIVLLSLRKIEKRAGNNVVLMIFDRLYLTDTKAGSSVIFSTIFRHLKANTCRNSELGQDFG